MSEMSDGNSERGLTDANVHTYTCVYQSLMFSHRICGWTSRTAVDETALKAVAVSYHLRQQVRRKPSTTASWKQRRVGSLQSTHRKLVVA
jgi:hypothetical protein